MALAKEAKTETIGQYKTHATDTGSPEVHVMLTWVESGIAYGDGELIALREPRLDVRTPDGGFLPPSTRISYRIGQPTFGLGPVNAGIVTGVLVATVLWAVNLPFGIAASWWSRRHGILQQSWGSIVFSPWGGLLRTSFMTNPPHLPAITGTSWAILPSTTRPAILPTASSAALWKTSRR